MQIFTCCTHTIINTIYSYLQIFSIAYFLSIIISFAFILFVYITTIDDIYSLGALLPSTTTPPSISSVPHTPIHMAESLGENSGALNLDFSIQNQDFSSNGDKNQGR